MWDGQDRGGEGWEALAEPGLQAAAAAAGGWGSMAGAQAQQELQASSRHSRKRSSHR